jgi:probable HAF family extracellular repeat protein
MLKYQLTLTWTGLYTSSRILALVLTLTFACQSLLNAAQARSRFTVTDLGSSVANGLNERGQVVGVSQFFPFGRHAFIYTDGQMEDLGILRVIDSGSYAQAINNHGQVAGTSWNPFETRAFLYSDGLMQDLGILVGDPNQPFQGRPVLTSDATSYAMAINNRSQVVGYSSLTYYFPQQHAFLYSNGVMQDLGTLAGIYGNFSEATGINNRGEIVGVSDTVSGIRHAFFYQDRQMRDIGSLSGQFSQANAINDHGKIVGQFATTGIFPYHAFLYSGGHTQDLGTLGGACSVADSINNRGQIVGYSFTVGTTTEHAFLYDDGKMLDLNNLLDSATGWTLSNATGINDAGLICGNGTFNGQPHAFLLAPVK